MRIALLTETTGPGGLETMLVTLSELLRERGHTVVPLVRESPRDWLLDTFLARGFPVETFPLGQGWRSSLRATRRVAAILRRVRPQVLHCHDFTAAIVGGRAAGVTSVPAMITLHGSPYYAGRWYRRLLLRLAVRRSRAAVAVSRSLASDVEQHLGLAPGSFNVVPNGTVLRPGNRERGRRALGLLPWETGILAVGRLEAVKGMDLLLRAMALRDLAGRPGVRLAIAGDGGERAALEGLASDLGILPAVRFLGMRNDVPDLLAGSDLMVLPSRSEGLPMALIEGMGMGLPVVAARVGGIPEVVDEGGTGLLVSPQSPEELAGALVRLLEDTSLRERLGRAARERVEQDFSAAGMVQRYEALYRAAAGP